MESIINEEIEVSDVSMINISNFAGNLLANVGFHLSKEANFTSTISKYIQSRDFAHQPVPAQMYISSNRSAAFRDVPVGDRDSVQKLIKDFNLPLYIHGSLIINLSRPSTRRDPLNVEWGVNLMKRHFINASQMGARGVVFHVGKYTGQSPEVGYNNMIKYTRQVLEGVTEECPFLIETPAGQGTELCTSFEDFSKFYREFSDVEHRKLKVCIDTCHVFAAGYDPLEYLQGWVAHHGPDSLGLIHLNDSKVPAGKRVDRHAFIGNGHIGMERMSEIVRWSDSNKYHMVIE